MRCGSFQHHIINENYFKSHSSISQLLEPLLLQNTTTTVKFQGLISEIQLMESQIQQAVLSGGTEGVLSSGERSITMQQREMRSPSLVPFFNRSLIHTCCRISCIVHFHFSSGPGYFTQVEEQTGNPDQPNRLIQSTTTV